jgi:hypothetical protein
MTKTMQLDSFGAADYLIRLPEHRLAALANRGTVGPSIGRGLGDELVDRVAQSLKPATLKVSAGAAAYALDLGLVVKGVETVASGRIVDFVPWPEATGEFAPDHPGNDECVLYAAAATPEAMDSLEAAYRMSLCDGDEGQAGGVELCFSLGYSVPDIAAWLLNVRRLAQREAVVDA